VSLQAGTTLGPYEILSPLGAGGMGEVYLANDSKLDRKVAIKVLPEAMTRDRERVARFEREAKLLASLNHPNIAAIHGFDDAEGTRFLIMEYVEGETLGSHLKKGPVAVEDALDIAKQITEALEAAHERGVIHRDLKPANVMIREDGTVKVLDFGLAKAMADEPSGGVDANSPTITANYTRPGVVLGTAAYMSPEQARGRPLDKRTDIWSFGIMLYECLTGTLLFRGETASDSIGAILHKDPDWSLLPPGTPPTIQLLLRRCLTKDRKRRLHDIADARIELENAIVDPTSSSFTLAGDALRESPRTSRRVWAVTLLFAGILIGALCVFLPMVASMSSVERSVRTPVRFSFSVTETDAGDQKKQLSPVRIAMAPDGAAMVIEVAGADQPLYVREMDTLTVRPLLGTKGALVPFFSPDGKTIGFIRDGRLMRIPRTGGASASIGSYIDQDDIPETPCWVNQNLIVFGDSNNTELFGIDPNTGKSSTLLSARDVPEVVGFEAYCRTPNPDYILVAGFTGNTIEDYAILALSLKDGSVNQIVSKATSPVVVGDEFLVYQKDSSLYAARFDFQTMRVAGSEVVVHVGVAADGWGSEGVYDVSSTGAFAYVPGQRASVGRHLAWVDRTGKVERASEKKDAFKEPLSISPDGKRVMVGTLRRASELWSVDLKTQSMRGLNTIGEAYNATWSATGTRIAYSRLRSEKGYDVTEVVVKDLESGEETVLPLEGALYYPRSWLADDSGLVIVRRERTEDAQEKRSLFVHLFDKPNETQPVFDSSAAISGGVLSHDGKWLVYVSDEVGHPELFVRAFPDNGRRLHVSGVGIAIDEIVRWAPDDTELYWVGNDRMIAAKFEKQAPAKISAPEALFESPWPAAPLRWLEFDVAPDGRFIMIEPAEWEKSPREISVVLNWVEELRAKVPTGTNP
jgi:eukaryotic-like serine/threonine-protein kinase